MKSLTDNEAYDALIAARKALGDAPGETVYSDTALKAARKALSGLALALLEAGNKAADERDKLKDPASP